MLFLKSPSPALLFLFFFLCFFFFFFNDTATTEIYTLSLHDALPIWWTSLLDAVFLRSHESGRVHTETRFARFQNTNRTTAQPSGSNTTGRNMLSCLLGKRQWLHSRNPQRAP